MKNVGDWLLYTHLLERGQEFVAAQARERQGAPGDAQLHTERRLVGAVPADVADHDAHGAVGELHRVEEVPADDSALSSGAVSRRCRDLRIVEQRAGEQPEALVAERAKDVVVERAEE